MENLTEFTGLLLLSGADQEGIASGLFETLAPFSIEIIDVEEFSIRGRTIFTLLFSLNKDHSSAIEGDLLQFAKNRDLDLAIDFTAIPKTDLGVSTPRYLVEISGTRIASADLHELARQITDSGGNIINFHRLSSSPTLRFACEVVGPQLSEITLSSDIKVSIRGIA